MLCVIYVLENEVQFIGLFATNRVKLRYDSGLTTDDVINIIVLEVSPNIFKSVGIMYIFVPYFSFLCVEKYNCRNSEY